VTQKKSLLTTPLAAMLAAAALLGGCSSVDLNDKPPVESRDTTAGAAGANANDGAQSAVAGVNVESDAAEKALAGVGNTVFFDFDSYVVKDEYRPIVSAYARALMANPNKNIAIEGHTDDRGGREYNLALGQKRAEAVQKAMALLGANASQIEAVSYGEEQPLATGSTEEAWAQNRRAEIKSR